MMKFFRFLTNKKESVSKGKAPQKDVSHVSVVVKDERKRDFTGNMAYESPRLGNVPKQSEGEQIAAGWPEWLTAVAGEALKGWHPRRTNSFEKIDKIGQGTYSNVYKARDLKTGQVVALKKVRFDQLEPESVRFMAREIIILRRLDHPNVVKLEGLVTSRMSCSLYLVFEFLDHDLARITASPNVPFTEAQVKCYLIQILRGLNHCHKRGVLHRDIKGSNLLLDREGNLKIADFGLATFFHPNRKQQLTTRVVTLWYRPPELLLGATEYGTAIDIWSVGCILGELFAGRPILPGRTEVEQLHKIFKLCGSPPEEYWKKYKLSHGAIFKPQHPYKRMLTETYKDFPQTALDLLDVMLALDPNDRGSASSALQSDFFNTRPVACEPSSLPKYMPPRVEGKGRDERGRRQLAAGPKARDLDPSKVESMSGNPSNPAPQEIKAEGNLNNATIMSNTQSARSKSERFIVKAKDIAAKLPIDSSRQHQQGGGTSHVYVLPPETVKQEPAVANTSWAGILVDDKPREEGFNAGRTRLPLSSRSVRQTLPDLTSQGSYEMKQSGTSLSKLSTLVATRNGRSQEFPHEGSVGRSSERFHGKKTSFKEASTGAPRPSHPIKGLDRLDLQEDVRHETNQKPGISGAVQILRYSSMPLLPAHQVNVEHIMHEHDQQIQQAFRKSRRERDKSQQTGELKGFGGRGVNAGAKGIVEIRESYERSMANSSRPNYRSSNKFAEERTRTKKMQKDKDTVYETYEYQDELQYL